jgi:hypothetical protein
VVVFWNPFPAGLVEEGRVVYVEGVRLTEWLNQQSPTIAAEQVPFIAVAINEARTPVKRTPWERVWPCKPKRDSDAGAALPT